ncbi:MAG: hypothetical protein KUF82_20615 [Candidatus Thiodiazotropha sp. (ex Ctena orbiculata)]|nr:hypothetical protein [Candidatus Thiodiazotropha taylori]
MIDLSRLNRFILTPHFRMETLDSVRLALRKDDWAISLDLKDAYFHIPIHPRSRRYLRFHFMGTTYQFRALAFGLAPAPYVFTRVVKTVVKCCHCQGLRLHAYLDDWLQPSASRDLSLFNRELLLKTVLRLGFVPNWDKSELVPSQTFCFLGARFDLVRGLIGPSLDRISRLQTFLEEMLAVRSASARQIHSLLGQMESVSRLLPHGRAHKRLLQWHLKDRWSQSEQSWDCHISLGRWFRQAVSHWLDKDFLFSLVPLSQPKPDFYLYTDASLVGWGAHLDDRSVSGLWSARWKEQHINVLELRAVWLALKSFCQVVSGNHILLSTDNTTVAAYLNKEGGARSRTLSFMATKLLAWCAKRQVSLTARFVPGKLNVLADSLSRKGQIIHTEWTLHMGTLSQIFHFWEVPHIDLFATRWNNRLPVFVSPVQDPLAWAVDAMSLSWEGMLAYAFPPFPLLLKVLLKIERENCLVILIAPLWESHPSFPILMSLLVAPAIRLPCRRDLLSQPHSRLVHPRPEVFNLHACLCCREDSKRQAFLESLPKEFVLPRELPRRISMITAGTLGWIGVSSGRWIPSIHL